MPEFIPDRFKEIWQAGLQNDQYALKICGAGGGGFIIGFASSSVDLTKMIGGTDFVEILWF